MPDFGQPPLPPNAAMGGGAPKPTFAKLAGSPGPTAPSQGPGQSQIGTSVVKMGVEIDQALKMLAQAIPTPDFASWVEQTCMDLREQIGNALNSGGIPTSPVPNDSVRMPDGSGRL